MPAPLRAKVEHRLPAPEPEVALPQRGQSVGLVLLRVALAADPEEPEVQKPHRAGQDTLANQSPALEVGVEPIAERGQPAGEVEHAIELQLVPALTPDVVVAVLLSPGGVDAGRLDVPAWMRTDPDVLPGRRDCQRADALEDLSVADRNAVRIAVGESAPAARSPQARPGAVDASKAWHRD